MCEGTTSDGRIGLGSGSWRRRCGGAGSGEISVGRPMWWSPNKDASEEGGCPSNSPLTVALRGSLEGGLTGKSNARWSAVPGVATVLQFPGLAGPESNWEGAAGQPPVGPTGMCCSGDAASIAMLGQALSWSSWPAGPGVGFRPSRNAFAISAAFHFAYRIFSST